MRSSIKRTAAAITLACGSSSAFAHHVADGKTPATWLEGLLSGLAHPVVDLDHLAFVLALALAAAFVERGWRLATVFGVALVAGVICHLIKADIPLAETMVALSVLAAGIALVTQRLTDARFWLGMSAGAGLVHGYTLGEAIIGAAPATVSCYVFGLVAAIGLIVLPVKTLSEMLLTEDRTQGLKLRAAGGAMTALGMYFLASAIVA